MSNSFDKIVPELSKVNRAGGEKTKRFRLLCSFRVPIQLSTCHNRLTGQCWVIFLEFIGLDVKAP